MAEVVEDTREFTIALEAPLPGELSLINVQYPGTAKKGAEIYVKATIKNIGGSDCQAKACLYEGHKSKGDTLKLIDCEASPCSTELITGEWCKLAPGQTETFECNTSFNPLWAMPDHPWNLTVHAVREG